MVSFYQSWKESSARVLGGESQDEFYNSVYEYLKNFLFSIVLGMIAFMPIVFRILINKNYYSAIYYVPILLLATYFTQIFQDFMVGFLQRIRIQNYGDNNCCSCYNKSSC